MPKRHDIRRTGAALSPQERTKRIAELQRAIAATREGITLGSRKDVRTIRVLRHELAVLLTAQASAPQPVQPSTAK